MPPSFLSKRQTNNMADAVLYNPALSPNENLMRNGRSGLPFTAADKALSDGALQASDLVSGSFTFDNAASTVVSVPGASSGSFALAMPSNVDAANLVGGLGLYVTPSTNQVTFTCNGTAAGTETFHYFVRL